MRSSSCAPLTLTLLSVFAGCGGASESDEVFEEPGAGRAGAGMSTAGASNASGGAGSPGAPMGGRTNTGGGMAAGGMSMGGGSGGSTAGSTNSSGAGGTATVPPELRDRCGALCMSKAEAECPNDPTVSECVMGCALLVQQPECVQAFDGLFDCMEGETFTCDDAGESTVTGCDAQAALAAFCFLGSVPDPALQAPCERYCADAQTAQCPNAESESDCVFGCQSAGSVVPNCSPAWMTYIECSDGAMYTCGDDGRPVAAGCEPDLLRFVACLLEGTQ